jgi:hypothetical protein
VIAEQLAEDAFKLVRRQAVGLEQDSFGGLEVVHRGP